MPKVRRRQNRMTLLCIIFAVFLVTGIFSMADLFIQSETANAKALLGGGDVGGIVTLDTPAGSYVQFSEKANAKHTLSEIKAQLPEARVNEHMILLAVWAPAKRAAKVSPVAAVSGNADAGKQKRHRANTSLMNIETALGVSHAASSKWGGCTTFT